MILLLHQKSTFSMLLNLLIYLISFIILAHKSKNIVEHANAKIFANWTLSIYNFICSYVSKRYQDYVVLLIANI